MAHVDAAHHEDDVLGEVGRVVGHALDVLGGRGDGLARGDAVGVRAHPREHRAKQAPIEGVDLLVAAQHGLGAIGVALDEGVEGLAQHRLRGGAHLGELGVARAGTIVTGAVLGVMILPTVARLAGSTLRAAPESLREASDALGASAWQTAWRVVVPSRGRGLVAAVGAGFARAAGETVAVQLLAARGGGPRTLTARIIDELPGAPTPSAWNHSLFAMCLVLLLLSTGVALLARPPARSSPSDEPSSLR